jgi:hypothetical protein
MRYAISDKLKKIETNYKEKNFVFCRVNGWLC